VIFDKSGNSMNYKIGKQLAAKLFIFATNNLNILNETYTGNSGSGDGIKIW
jgi:hypothetical protein